MPEVQPGDVAEIVKSAFERDSSEWPRFLDQACGLDTDLRAEVESLLNFGERAPRFMDEPAVHLAADLLAQNETLQPDQRLDQFEICSLIGSGGMGEVYLAQDTALGRKVALKLVKSGHGTANIIRHFHQEERILAGLNHPHIARLYGGGVTPNGLPFFIMEYVEGERLDEYCNSRRLTTHERLNLFRKVCLAVTYAHQNLVIHRDLKPANIRVTAEGEPKLLDFGIAKLIDSENAPTNGQTLTLRAVMTPEYASPEQVAGNSITTASDVYSLGVVLYHLLTGQSPYRTKTNRPAEIARAITDQEPVRPSTAVAAAAPPSKIPVARQRERRRSELRGDLDNIILMAMRKEPSRRYSSVGQFSADLQRHLDGLPVVARKDTFTYRSSKFIKRHRIGVAAAFLIVMSLVGGMVTTAWEGHLVRQEKIKAEEIKTFLERMLKYSSPVFTGKNTRETVVSDLLDEAARWLEDEKFSNQPEIKAELEHVISVSYFGQGKYDLARRHLQKYSDLQRTLSGQNADQALAASQVRAWLLFNRGEIAESEKIYRQILPPMRKERKKGSIHAETLATALNNFAYLRRTQGDSKEAELLFREALALSPEMSPDEWRYINGTTRSTLASTLSDQGRFEEALQTSREAVAEYRQRGETDTPNFGFTLTVLGGFLTEQEDFAEADASLREAEAIIQKFLDPSTLWLGDNLRNQALSFYRQGKYPEALNKATETLNIYRETFGTHYDHYPTALLIQGLSLTRIGDTTEGERIVREAARMRRETLPKEHYWVALANSALGECLAFQQRYSEAEPLLLASYETLKNSQGANNPRTRLVLQRLTELYERWPKPDLAAKFRAMLSQTSPDVRR